jgi:HD-like signal output (HDOD) protein
VSDNLASQTIQRIRDALEKGPIAGVPEIILLIQELTAKAFTITISELSELISRDVAVTAKVISAANTLAYNPTGVPISTITQAIHAIGFSKIRNLAISLMLIENVERTQTADEQKETAALALSSGLMAQAVAGKMGIRLLDPEQAFVCASLRNYGRLLMTTFLIEDYRKAINLSQVKGNEDLAFKEIFGLTPIELAYELLLSAHLPKTILHCLQDISPDSVKTSIQSVEDRLLLVSEFSVRLCETAMDTELDSATFENRCYHIFKAFEKSVFVDFNDLKDLFHEVDHSLRKFTQSYDIKSLSHDTLQTLHARARGKSPLPIAKNARKLSHTLSSTNQLELLESSVIASIKEPIVTEPMHPLLKKNPHEVFSEGILAMTRLLASSNLTLSAIHDIMIETLHYGLRLNNTLIFHQGKSLTFRPVGGIGSLYQHFKGKPLVSPQQKDVFGISLTRKEDVFIANATETKILSHIPSWVMHSKETKSFIILPVVENNKPYAILCGFHDQIKGIELTTRILQQIKALRIHMTTAYRLLKHQHHDS